MTLTYHLEKPLYHPRWQENTFYQSSHVGPFGFLQAPFKSSDWSPAYLQLLDTRGSITKVERENPDFNRVSQMNVQDLAEEDSLKGVSTNGQAHLVVGLEKKMQRGSWFGYLCCLPMLFLDTPSCLAGLSEHSFLVVLLWGRSCLTTRSSLMGFGRVSYFPFPEFQLSLACRQF